MDLQFATQSSIEAYYGTPQPFSMRAMILSYNDRPIAIGGVKREKLGLVAFMETKPEAVHHKKLLLKAAKYMKVHLFGYYENLYAVRDQSLESACRFLAYLGFESIDDNNEVFLWRRSR